MLERERDKEGEREGGREGIEREMPCFFAKITSFKEGEINVVLLCIADFVVEIKQ